MGQFDPRKYIGFCYLIEFKDGTKYIGSKKFWRALNEAPMEDTETLLPSSWKWYCSSQRAARDKAKMDKANTKFTILSLYEKYADVQLEENRLHTTNDVINNPLFINLKSASYNTVPSSASEITTTYWQDLDYRRRIRLSKVTNRVLKNPAKYSKYFAYVPTREEVELVEAKRVERYKRVGAMNSIRQKGISFSQERIDNIRKAARNKAPRSSYDSVSTGLKKYYAENGRSNEHVKNNVAARKKDANGKCIQRIVQSLVVDGTEYRSFRSASTALGISEYKLKLLVDVDPSRIQVNYKQMAVIKPT